MKKISIKKHLKFQKILKDVEFGRRKVSELEAKELVVPTNQNPLPSVKTVALEGLMLDVILSFCENAAQLGCPKTKEVDMWIRELEPQKAIEVMEKLLCIIEKPWQPKYPPNIVSLSKSEHKELHNKNSKVIKSKRK